MTYADAFEAWNASYRPAVVETYGKDDDPAHSESWNDYTDMLCKEGEFTALQYQHCPAYDADDMPTDEDGERDYIIEAVGVTMTATQADKRPDSLMQDSATHYRCTIRRGVVSVLSVWYSQGSAHTQAPDIASVVGAILMDTAGLYAGITFEDWAGDNGMDEDSRRAERIFTACCMELRHLEAMFQPQELEDLRTLFEDF